MSNNDYNPNIINEITEWVNHSVQGSGERIQYAVSQVVIPTQNGMAPALAISLTLPGLVLGEVAQSFGIINLLGNTQESIGNYVRQAIEGMRQERSDVASKVTQSAGQSQTPSGLILG